MSTTLNESSSSEDDEVLEALKEATDSRLLNESLFRTNTENGSGNGKKRKENEIELPKTLRRTNEHLDIFNDFGVTQDFKNFVAKELAKSLDKCLREEKVHRINDAERNKSERRADTSSVGIKLMTDSKECISVFEENDRVVSGHNKRCKREFQSEDNFAERAFKCEKVAVEPEWVLSKVSTSVWTERPKGAIYKYKKSDTGVLVEIE